MNDGFLSTANDKVEIILTHVNDATIAEEESLCRSWLIWSINVYAHYHRVVVPGFGAVRIIDICGLDTAPCFTLFHDWQLYNLSAYPSASLSDDIEDSPDHSAGQVAGVNFEVFNEFWLISILDIIDLHNRLLG